MPRSSARRTLALLASAALVAVGVPALSQASAGAAPAAAADGPVFTPLPGYKLAGGARVKPKTFVATRVDLTALRGALRQAPALTSTRTLLVRVPTPTGGTERFAVQRTQLMESKLAAKHPELATYAGRSLDHRGTTIALDTTPMGFHASVRGPLGQHAWYVDPAYDKRGTTVHLSYVSGAVSGTVKDFVERVAPEIKAAAKKRRQVADDDAAPVVRRAYRLALTSDPSYAEAFGTENVLAEKITLINRVNQIYNDDLAITLRLVNQTDDLNLDTDAKATEPNGPCGAHPCFDPAGEDPDTQPGQLDFCDVPTLGRNRTVLGQLVGASNYDIGHIALGVNGGGVAYLGVVGGDYKGGGCTGLPDPEGDFFAIDYVAHEMGHQFGGNHTFDGHNGSCDFGNRNQGTSVEPGSGSSVMAYAGICGTDDLQPHTDPYFSQRSIEEMSTYTGDTAAPVVEVQTVSLRGFDTDGDTITLGSGDADPITLTRGTDYDAAHIEAAIEELTGKDVTVAQWGYDPYNTFTAELAPIEEPDDTGFQVIFAGDADPATADSDFEDEDPLTVSSDSPGVSGFVGETAKGGDPDNEGDQTETRNHAPVVTAPVDKTIPTRTPFKLQGSGSDVDGDSLTYLWEQNDTGDLDGTDLISNDKVSGPLFRVFGVAANVTDEGTLESPSPGENLADGSPVRNFPDMAQVLAGNTNAKTGACPVPEPPEDPADDPVVTPAERDCYSEFLPIPGYVGTFGSTTPAMHFRITARDGFVNGGGTAFDDVTLKIKQGTGPFLVSSHYTGRTLKKGSSTTVTWKVNGTNTIASKVKVLLSVDGGYTWKYTLASSTANDGSVAVRLPKVAVSKARIMVKPTDNYFFSVNAKTFKIS